MRPRQTLGRQLDVAARHAFPAVSTVVLMLLAEAPFGFANQTALLPAITLACVFFWSLVRPAAGSAGLSASRSGRADTARGARCGGPMAAGADAAEFSHRLAGVRRSQ